MEKTAVFVAIFVSIFGGFIAISISLALSGKRAKAAEEKAHARRLAEAKMNARLLRFNL